MWVNCIRERWQRPGNRWRCGELLVLLHLGEPPFGIVCWLPFILAFCLDENFLFPSSSTQSSFPFAIVSFLNKFKSPFSIFFNFIILQCVLTPTLDTYFTFAFLKIKKKKTSPMLCLYCVFPPPFILPFNLASIPSSITNIHYPFFKFWLLLLFFPIINLFSLPPSLLSYSFLRSTRSSALHLTLGRWQPLTAADDVSSPLTWNISSHRRCMMTPTLRVVGLGAESRTLRRTPVVSSAGRWSRSFRPDSGHSWEFMRSSLLSGCAFWERGSQSDPTSERHDCTLWVFKNKNRLLAQKGIEEKTLLAPLMTRRIIKCNEWCRFVARHFNCVGCGIDRASAVSVVFSGGFCCICIPGTKMKKTSVARHELYLLTAEKRKEIDRR